MVADERMNVSQPLLAHVVFRFGVGGLENGIVNLINHLPRERWRHAIISLTDVAPEFTERIARPDVCYVALATALGLAANPTDAAVVLVLKRVEETPKGPRLILSRSDPLFVQAGETTTVSPTSST